MCGVVVTLAIDSLVSPSTVCRHTHRKSCYLKIIFCFYVNVRYKTLLLEEGSAWDTLNTVVSLGWKSRWLRSSDLGGGGTRSHV